MTDLINDLGFFKGHDLLLIDEAHNFIDIVLQSKKISLSIQKILKFIIEFHQKVMKVTPSEIFLLKEIDNLNALLNESLKIIIVIILNFIKHLTKILLQLLTILK